MLILIPSIGYAHCSSVDYVNGFCKNMPCAASVESLTGMTKSVVVCNKVFVKKVNFFDDKWAFDHYSIFEMTTSKRKNDISVDSKEIIIRDI